MKKNLPKISIITPSYNQGKFLEKTILSVINQIYPNLEYIVIDGGSTDNSIDIIKKYSDSIDYWVSEPDKGQSEAINKGFEKATGDIYAWINSDDVYYPGVLSKVADEFMKNLELDFLFGTHDDIDKKGNVFRKGTYFPFIPKLFVRGYPQICQPESFWKKNVWEKCGPLDLNIHYSMDYDFFYKVVKDSFEIRRIHLNVCQFRYHDQSKGVKDSRIVDSFAEELIAKHFPNIKNKNNSLFIKSVINIIRLIARVKRSI